MSLSKEEINKLEHAFVSEEKHRYEDVQFLS
jgi:hypothetical protein